MNKNITKQIHTKISFSKTTRTIFLFTTLFLLTTSCSSIFFGGASGIVVDSESTSTPKNGIPNVDVYAYTDESERNSDYSNWKEGTIFTPNSDYYGHTTTNSDGSFVISRIVWKEKKPAFGKDADTQIIYLLFYHKDYGLTKGSTLIVSDSTSDTVYQELKSIRKSTLLTLNFEDITGSAINTPLYVSVTVPQTTEKNTTALPITYEQEITERGVINISYPRWQNDENKSDGIETTPEITIKYFQSSEEVDWKGCYNEDNEEKNFAFREDSMTGIKKIIQNNIYELTFYGKRTKLSMPVISGQYKSSAESTSADDGVIISLKRKNGTELIDCGEVTTFSQELGNTGTEKHGMFNNLGAGSTWTDFSYIGKYAEAEIEIFADGVSKKTMTVRSNVNNYNVQLE